jgi:hypothetical protein
LGIHRVHRRHSIQAARLVDISVALNKIKASSGAF